MELPSLTTPEIQALLLTSEIGVKWVQSLYPDIWDSLVRRELANPTTLSGAGARLVRFWDQVGLTFQYEITQALGYGGGGAAFLLTDNSVLKITQDSKEKQCVIFIMMRALKNPHLPILYDAGEIGSWFFYIREPLNDIPWEENERQFEKAALPLELELYKLGLTLDDSLSTNWGVRPNDPRNPLDPVSWVVRDLSCDLYL